MKNVLLIINLSTYGINNNTVGRKLRLSEEKWTRKVNMNYICIYEHKQNVQTV